jgi:hypothetical protein
MGAMLVMNIPVKSYRCTRNNRIFDLMTTCKDGFYWHERDYRGPFVYGATFGYNPQRLERDIANGIVVEIKEQQ